MLERRIRSPVALYFVERSPETIFPPFVEQMLMSAIVSFRKFTSIQEDMVYRAKRTQQQCYLEMDRGINFKKNGSKIAYWSQVYYSRYLLLDPVY